MFQRILSALRPRPRNSLYWAQLRLRQLQDGDYRGAEASARKAHEALQREAREVRHG